MTTMNPLYKQIFEKMFQLNAKPSVGFNVSDKSSDVWHSKFGGKAYLPKDAEYPVDADGNPMYLLCQLNLDKCPQYKNFPNKGMLQFFITTDDQYQYGADYDNPTADGYKRVAYYETVLYDAAKLKEPPEVASDNTPLLRRELAIEFDSCDYSPLQDLDDYGTLLNEACAILGVQLTKEQYSEMLDLNVVYGTQKVGGKIELYKNQSCICGFTDNLSFAQGDGHPDGYVNLVQFESVHYPDVSDYLILWGDAGTAHYFIKPENLERRDFAKTYYVWDCG
jgi:uncharacterized protein YwqG